MDKKAWNLSIFTLGVIMLLLRPYMIYQLTQQKTLANNPFKVYSLLQRLVKKKDEHHELAETVAMESRRSKTIFRLPVVWIKIFHDYFLGFLFLSTIWVMVNTLFRKRPENHRYRLLSCFQI